MPGPIPDPTVRSRLLDVADRLLARDGYRCMTIDAVAAESGVGKGSVYLHFRSKEDLALSCIDRMAGRIVARLEAIAARRASATARLRAMLTARVLERFDYACKHAASLDALLAAVRPRLLAHRAEHFGAEADVFARVLAEGGRDGTLRAVPAASTAWALVTATNALLPYSLSAAELGRRPQLQRRTAALAALLLRGLLAPTSSRTTPSPLRRRSS
jgi:AcrR family transcriptional regulator